MYLPEMLLVSASWICFWVKMEPGEKVNEPIYPFIDPVNSRLIHFTIKGILVTRNALKNKIQHVQVMMLKLFQISTF